MPNMPGRIEVANVNPEGREFRLGTWQVAAGQKLMLPMQGTFQFSGPTGDEVLKLAFAPCSSGVQGRDIVVNATATVDYSSVLPVL